MNSDAESELVYEEFVRARKLHRREQATQRGADSKGGFMLYSSGPRGMIAVFEEAGSDGWFYLYDAGQQSIVRGTHIYDRADIQVEEDVVDIGWAVDDSACGLALWGQFRAFLGVSNGLEIRKRVIHADEDGIPATEWPSGFEHYLEKKIE